MREKREKEIKLLQVENIDSGKFLNQSSKVV